MWFGILDFLGNSLRPSKDDMLLLLDPISTTYSSILFLTSDEWFDLSSGDPLHHDPPNSGGGRTHAGIAMH